LNGAGGWRKVVKMIILRGVVTVTLYFRIYRYKKSGRWGSGFCEVERRGN
jgi:hypothetical protein